MSNTRNSKTAGPVTLSRGRYAIQQTPEGEGVISYRPDGSDEDQHQVIPKSFWGLLLRILAGEKVDPMSIMKTLMGG